MAAAKIETVDAYIATKPAGHQPILRRLRKLLQQALPDAEESISYAIPAYKVAGRAAIYFAGWKEHWSLYPVNEAAVEALAETLKRVDYEVSKGTIRIPYAGTMPTHFIQRVARLRGDEARGKKAAAPKKVAAKKKAAAKKKQK